MILTIAIPTVIGREEEYEKLEQYIDLQITGCSAREEVEIIRLKDDKTMSIGKKRDTLYQMAQGKYTVMIDDDDTIHPEYIKKVLEALKDEPDCVGYYERVYMDGIQKKSIISLAYKSWRTLRPPRAGTHYLRSPFYKVPIKTEICQRVGVKDLRYGEDHDFSVRILPELKSEYFIPEYMYIYTAHTLTPQQQKERYGIRD